MIIKQRTAQGSQDIVTPLLGEDETGHGSARTADSYFPLDVAYQASCGSNLLFRLEVQEYEAPTSSRGKSQAESKQQSEESELKSLFSHILSNDERNAFLFTYDLSSSYSFKLELKKAIKELIFAHEEVEDYKAASHKKLTSEQAARGHHMVPYLIVGMKKDKKHKVTTEEQQSLVTTLKKYMKCDH